MSSISSQYFSSMLTIFEKMGMDSDALAKTLDVDLEDLKNPKFRIEVETLAEAFDIAERELDEPNIGLEACYRFRIATFTETGSILAHCSSLAQAAEMNARYARLVETVGVSSLARRDDGVFLAWDESYDDHNRYRHVTELIIGGYVLTTNWLSWVFDKGAKSVSFRHDAPADISRYERVFKCPVLFGQDENKMAFYEDIVDQHLPTANPEKLIRFQEILNGHIASFESQSAFRTKVTQAVEKAIRDGGLSLPRISESLGLSERSLRRNLTAEGVTYRELVDQVRRNICDAYMKDGRSFTEIAQILGYNDQSAFTRAFKKWHGMSPTEYRPNNFSM